MRAARDKSFGDFLHREFVFAAMIALAGTYLIIRAVASGSWFAGAVLLIVFGVMTIAIFREGWERWVAGEGAGRAWAHRSVRRLLGRTPHALSVPVAFPSEEGDAADFLVDFVIRGDRGSAILVIGFTGAWDRNGPDADAIEETLVLCRDALDAERAILWLPVARRVGWRTRLWPHIPGVRVVTGRPERLRKHMRPLQAKLRWHERFLRWLMPR